MHNLIETRPSVARALVELDITKRYPERIWLGPNKFGGRVLTSGLVGVVAADTLIVVVEPSVGILGAEKDPNIIATDVLEGMNVGFCDVNWVSWMILPVVPSLASSYYVLSPFNVVSMENIPFIDVPVAIISNEELKTQLAMKLKDSCADQNDWLDGSFSSPCRGDGEDIVGTDDEYHATLNVSRIIEKAFSSRGGKRRRCKSKRNCVSSTIASVFLFLVLGAGLVHALVTLFFMADQEAELFL
ncbi:hypothetical protein IEQ34_013404 [Dendrobium chrysotoxum]|uniref:Uncharacterized protein n=1 Tax=Dendrobium chrysotoxum TaxID=161865 RepID=A0AAV7GRK6_DENCH|nr:hypothetical protein IEQ34_013404 [Dendrobium chrysotoxum]